MSSHPLTINADLHCHSVFSDGTLTPQALAERAASQGVQLWALTDHDEISGLEEAHAHAKAHGIDFLTGVEISVTFAGTTVHIVGLGFDRHNQQLIQGLAQTRAGRTERAKTMGSELAKVGIEDAYEGALKYVGNPDLISRTHFARLIVDRGICSDVSEVFRRYLAEGKPGYVPHQWATLGDSVRWITEAGGIAVIAHPGRYRFTPTEEYALFSEFKAHGGTAVEVVTGSHTPQEYVEYAAMAKEFDLLASRGSDFHSPEDSRINLGDLPPLPSTVSPVWEPLSDKILRA